MKIEIVTEDLDREVGACLLAYLVEATEKYTRVTSAKIINTPRVRDCSKEVCACDY